MLDAHRMRQNCRRGRRMIYEKFVGYPERPRNRGDKVSELRAKLAAHREHLRGETNPGKRSILEDEMAWMARKIVQRS